MRAAKKMMNKKKGNDKNAGILASLKSSVGEIIINE